MLDIAQELKNLIMAFEAKGIPYALCGGLAMAVYSEPRATIDIDVIALAENVDLLMETAKDLGFDLPASPMSFAKGAVEIRRVTKIDTESGDYLPLDLILVTDALRPVWEGREQRDWGGLPLWVVSREGLIFMKSLRSSGRDQDDIDNLRAGA
jgi:hypothetical protein